MLNVKRRDTHHITGKGCFARGGMTTVSSKVYGILGKKRGGKKITKNPIKKYSHNEDREGIVDGGVCT